MDSDDRLITREAKDGSIVRAIIEAVAEAERVDGDELDSSLYDHIDPDALEDLFAATNGGPPRTAGLVEFTFDGYVVRARASGTVEVTPADGRRGDRTAATGADGEAASETIDE